nr:S26 family signal peptidase [Pseudomonas antarctica]
MCWGIAHLLGHWSPIPSGSMRPTLAQGDGVLVNRVAYDLKVPLTDISLHADRPCAPRAGVGADP